MKVWAFVAYQNPGMGETMTFDEFLQTVCPPLDLQWRKYRRRASRRQVRTRMAELGLLDLASYAARIRLNPEEGEALADLMRVTVSRFFREKRRWAALADVVLPELVEARKGQPLRALSVGCCGGEEPYTLAVVWKEAVKPRFPRARIEITAVDIDKANLERARLGLYDASSLREVPPGARGRWFHREDGHFRIAEEIRARVRFEARNFMTDPLPEGCDLVLCRYLAFTYYKGERRLQAARRLWRALRPGGALMIGRKEGLGPAEGAELFEPWPGVEGVFRRREGP